MHEILKFFGLAADEYHHIVASFNQAVTSLETLAKRKADDAMRAAAQIDIHREIKVDAETAKEQAEKTAAKLRALIA